MKHAPNGSDSRYTRRTVEDYIATLGTDLYIYREDDSRGSKAGILSIPKIMNEYLAELNIIYVQTENTP